MASTTYTFAGKVIERIQPRNAQVLIEKLKETKTAGGIILPDSRPNDLPTERGKVVAAGPGRLLDSGELVPMDLKEGDEVMYHAFPSGVEVREEGKQYIMIDEKQVVCKLGALDE